MPLFIKTERFTAEAVKLSKEKRQQYINEHCSWVAKLNKSGVKVCSGYLANEKGVAGGGGMLVIEAKSFVEAQSFVKKDPMIISNLVHWNIQEWIPVVGILMN